MKVKVGNKLYDGKVQPIMVILTEQDKINIQNMPPQCTKYAIFAESFGTKEEKFDWMKDEGK